MITSFGRQSVPKHTIYSVEDKEGRVHTVRIPEEPEGLERFNKFFQKLIWRLFVSGVIFCVGYFMGLLANG